MDMLRRRILSEGQNLGKGILKIDSFLNHQLDVQLMEAVGEEIAVRFAEARPSRILTAEVSGIVPAAMAGKALGNIPVVYARKHKPITMTRAGFPGDGAEPHEGKSGESDGVAGVSGGGRPYPYRG